MHIGADGSFLSKPHTGMAVMLKNILLNMDTSDLDISLFVPGKLDVSLRDSFTSAGIEVNEFKNTNFIIWEQFTLPRLAKQYSVDLMIFPNNTGSLKIKCKKIVFINDLIYFNEPLKMSPTIYKKCGKLYRRLIVPRVLRSSDAAVTISKYSKEEIVNRFPYCQDKLKVIYLGFESSTEYLTQNEWDSFREINGISNKYFVGYGSNEARKNTKRLIEGFCIYKDEHPNCEEQLVLFGFKSDEDIKRYNGIEKFANSVIFLGYLSIPEKNSLESNSLAFVFPSFAEGFGMPVLEGMACGTIVVTSNKTSIPEVSGNAALVVDPFSASSIAKQLSKVAKYNDIEREKWIKAGRERVLLFGWAKTAEAVKLLTLSQISK